MSLPFSIRKALQKLALFAMAAMVLTACAAQVTQLQQLPEEGVKFVSILITAGVTWGLLKLGALLHIELRGYADAAAVALSPIIVGIIENYLRLIPEIYDSIVLTIIHLVILLVGSLGTFWILQRRPAPTLR